MKNKNNKTNKTILAALFILLILFFAIRLASINNITIDHQNYELVKHNYDFNNLKNNEQIKSYDDENYTSLFGIDLSYHQGDINWQELSNNQLDFIYLRVGYRGFTDGGLFLDDKFLEYVNASNEYEIPVGYYFFDQAITVKEAVAEAKFVLEYEKDYPSSYPIVLDLEPIDNSRTSNLNNQERTDIALAFLQTISATGKEVMIYSSGPYLLDFFNYEQLANYSVWLAHYTDIPNFPYQFKIWQYSETGTLSGISELVDLNIMFVEKES